MSRQLRSFVYVPDESGEGSRGFGPGDSVPGWAAKLITNPKAWADGADTAADEPASPSYPDARQELRGRARAAGASDEDIEQLGDLDDAEVAALNDLNDEDLRALIETADEDELPPKGGSGSGIDAWLAYAKEHDIDVPEDASRDDVIAAVEAASK